MAAIVDLKDLREQPFQLLLELERRCRSAAVGQNVAGASTNEWVGIGVRIGTLSFVISRTEVREVLEYPAITPVPKAKHWVLGLANVRGQLLPIFDLHGFVTGKNIRPDRRARVVSASHPEIPAGLVVNEVFGFRRFSEADYRDSSSISTQTGLSNFGDYLAGCFVRAGDNWPVLGLRQLLDSVKFSQASE